MTHGPASTAINELFSVRIWSRWSSSPEVNCARGGKRHATLLKHFAFHGTTNTIKRGYNKEEKRAQNRLPCTTNHFKGSARGALLIFFFYYHFFPRRFFLMPTKRRGHIICQTVCAPHRSQSRKRFILILYIYFGFHLTPSSPLDVHCPHSSAAL